MSDLINIAIDAMGGDNAPKKIIDGIILNHKSNKKNFFKIFGNENEISKFIINKIDYLTIYFDDFREDLSEKT